MVNIEYAHHCWHDAYTLARLSIDKGRSLSIRDFYCFAKYHRNNETNKDIHEDEKRQL